MTKRKNKFPEYYKDITFRTSDGKEHEGYLEPLFVTDDDGPFFVEPNGNEGGIGDGFYSSENVTEWKYKE